MKEQIRLKELDAGEMGKRIRRQREFMKMSREDLAGHLSVSSKFIADLEYGDKGISIRKLYQLAQILDVSTDYILAGSKEGTEEQVRKERLKEEILEPLRDCSSRELECMEQISRFYAQALKKK